MTLQEDALTNPRVTASAPVGVLTWSLVESVPLVKEVACLVVLGSASGNYRLDASEPTDRGERKNLRADIVAVLDKQPLCSESLGFLFLFSALCQQEGGYLAAAL
ncbi:hypothetical protein BGW80DRAFT_1254940 [Lactifluus volemus]|nr:hypothetical protein BGW80DRAFT_1254940 [Lactifluus volemus]